MTKALEDGMTLGDIDGMTLYIMGLAYAVHYSNEYISLSCPGCIHIQGPANLRETGSTDFANLGS